MRVLFAVVALLVALGVQAQAKSCKEDPRQPQCQKK